MVSPFTPRFWVQESYVLHIANWDLWSTSTCKISDMDRGRYWTVCIIICMERKTITINTQPRLYSKCDIHIRNGDFFHYYLSLNNNLHTSDFTQNTFWNLQLPYPCFDTDVYVAKTTLTKGTAHYLFFDLHFRHWINVLYVVLWILNFSRWSKTKDDVSYEKRRQSENSCEKWLW